MSTQFYQRSVDAGNGKQFVEVVNGTIARQWLEANQGHYTSDGNPELEGNPKSALRGYGFRKVSKSQNDRMLEDSIDWSQF